MMVATNTDLPDEAAYKITKAYWDNLAEMKAGNALLRSIDASRPFAGVNAPLHPGALRYYREAGFTIPSINANNLWQSVEGEIEGWVGSEDMLATLRQLTSVAPDQPRVVVDMPIDQPSFVGGPAEAAVAPYSMQRRIVEVLAGGGQFVLNPIAGGQTPGFWPGRDGTDAARY